MSTWFKGGCFAVLAAALMCWAVPQPAVAQSMVVKERRALMKENSGHIKAIFGYLKAGKGTAADVAMHARGLGTNAGRMSAMFPKGTSLNDNAGETGAKPEIWQDWPKFLAAADTLGKLSFELALTAGKGDKGAIGGAMKTFGKVGCGGCHRSFRKKLKK